MSPEDDVRAILQEQGQDRRELGERLRAERDPKTQALQGERALTKTAGEWLAELEHEATKRSWNGNRVILEERRWPGDGVTEHRILRVYDTTPTFSRTPRYTYAYRDWTVQRNLTRESALALLAQAIEGGS